MSWCDTHDVRGSSSRSGSASKVGNILGGQEAFAVNPFSWHLAEADLDANILHPSQGHWNYNVAQVAGIYSHSQDSHIRKDDNIL